MSPLSDVPGERPPINVSESARRDPIVSVPDGHEANYTVTPKESPEDAAFRRMKEGAIFVVGLLFVICLSAYAFWTLWDPQATVEQKRLAWTAVVSIGTAFLGFLVGKKV